MRIDELLRFRQWVEAQEARGITFGSTLNTILAFEEAQPPEPSPRTRTEANKTLGNCLLALQEYFREWPLDDDVVSIHVHDGRRYSERYLDGDLPDDLVAHNRLCWMIRDTIRSLPLPHDAGDAE